MDALALRADEGRDKLRTETSKYPEEKKETSISKVAASEMERAQTVVRAPRGCGLHKVLESIAEQFWEI